MNIPVVTLQDLDRAVVGGALRFRQSAPGVYTRLSDGMQWAVDLPKIADRPAKAGAKPELDLKVPSAEEGYWSFRWRKARPFRVKATRYIDARAKAARVMRCDPDELTLVASPLEEVK